MAAERTLDGFTITRVGEYDESTWRRHYESHGEELGDDEGAAQAEGATPAIRVPGVRCRIVNNLVHHNGDVGIAVLGDEQRRTTPLIAKNFSYRNMGGGIGAAGRTEAVIRDNACFENQRAGIRCRGASPLVLNNRCYKNIRAGIGCREAAQPTLRRNHCYQNRRAGIGVRMAKTAPI